MLNQIICAAYGGMEVIMEKFSYYPVGFLLSRTQAKLQNKFLKKLRPYKITPEQWVLLIELSEEKGISPTELSQISFRDKPYTTRLVDKLEKRGLVRREENQEDKRSSLLFLPKKGSDFKKEVLPVVLGINKWATETMSEEEVEQLRILLNKMYAQIKN